MFDMMFESGKGHDWIGEAHAEFAAKARLFFEADLVQDADRWLKAGEIDRGFWNRAGAKGLIASSLPKELGGAGSPRSFDGVIAYEAARVGDTSWGFGPQSIVVHYIATYGSPEQKVKFLPRLANGELVAAICMTEPHAGSDLQNIRTKARLVGDRYRIDGGKTFITNGGQCDVMLLAARTENIEGAKGISLLIVETKDAQGADAKGFRRGRRLEKLGMKGQDTFELFFEGLEAPAESVLGGANGMGFAFMMQELPWERLVLGISAVGSMDFMLRETLRSVLQRDAAGRRSFDQQNTRFKLAEVKARLEVCRAYVMDALGKLDRGELDASTASTAKFFCTQMQNEAADECLQLLAEEGTLANHPVARAFADCRVQKIYGGANEIMKELIARSLET